MEASPATPATPEAATAGRRESPGWAVVARHELGELWGGGRGLLLLFGFSVLIAVIAYLAATNQSLNFLEQRESTNLTLQAAVAVGSLLVLVTAADSISGERERGTLEALLLTPLPRSQLLLGKLLSPISIWLAAMTVAAPFVWALGHDVGVAGKAIAIGYLLGTTLAIGLAGFGVLISTFARSNRVSLSVSLFVLLALYAPTQLPTGAQSGWFGDLLLRVNPISAAENYIGKIVIDGHGWTQDASWLISPIAAAVLFSALALAVAPRFLTLSGSGSR